MLTRHARLCSPFVQLIEFCNTVANAGKTVVVGALDGTFAALVRSADGVKHAATCRVSPACARLHNALPQPFGGVCNLVPFSTSVSKLRAVCVGCCGDAGAWGGEPSADAWRASRLTHTPHPPTPP